MRRSLVKPRRKPDLDFAEYYSSLGKDVNQIPEFRNTTFDGSESYLMFAKYAAPEPVLGADALVALNIASDWMIKEFYAHMSGSKMLSAQEVIDGTEGSNSPGFPWNTIHRSCDEFYSSNDATFLERFWDESTSPDGSWVVWNTFLKEELRKIEKIDRGDIRQINGCPVEFKISMNRYCLDQNQRFYDSNLVTASAVGINKFHGGWDRLYRKLNRHPRGFSLDVKKWDARFPRCLMEVVRDFRWNCLFREYRTPENHVRFVNLYEQIIKSITVMNWGELLQTQLGNPSGSPNTVVDNTLGLYIMVAFCYIRSCQDQGIDPSYGVFNSEIALVLYGDDNTFTGSEQGLQRLNFAAMHKYAADLGFEVTDGGSSEPRLTAELDFLSSSFAQLQNGMMIPKPTKPHKALASMAFRCDGNRLNAWSRACAHRINSYYEPETFRLADGFCRFLLSSLDKQAEAEGWLEQWIPRRAEYLPERKLQWLYCSTE